MESDYFWSMIWKLFWALLFIVGAVLTAWRKVKEKRKLNALAMRAIVEVERMKFENDDKPDGSKK